MTNPPPPRRRPPPVGFQPRFTLLILYFAICFFAFATILILPDLLEVLETLPPGPEQEAAATEAARAALGRTQLAGVFLLSTLTVALGAYYKVLPGMRDL